MRPNPAYLLHAATYSLEGLARLVSCGVPLGLTDWLTPVQAPLLLATVCSLMHAHNIDVSISTRVAVLETCWHRHQERPKP